MCNPNTIFINCPFDDKYKEYMFKPMLYFIKQIGFQPKISSEFSDSGQFRLEKIVDLIKSCMFSIHDISMMKSTVIEDYARMNMPFELGIDYGLRKSGNEIYEQKKYLILEGNKYDYQKAISDLNGFDIKVHHNDTIKLFECLYSWTSETLKVKVHSPPLKMFNSFNDFSSILIEEKTIEFGDKDYALNYIETLSIPDYLLEIDKRN